MVDCILFESRFVRILLESPEASMSKFLPFRVEPFSEVEEYVGRKWKVTKVVFFDKNGGKLTKYIE